MKTQIKNGLAGLLTAGAIGLGSLVGYDNGNSQEQYSTQASASYAQNEGRATITEIKNYEFKRPKYHPSIEDFEKKLEREVSSLVPTYYEFKCNENLKAKINKVRENPKIVQNNKYYKEFSKHLAYHYKNPDEKGFLFGESLANVIESSELVRGDLRDAGLDFNFEKLTEADKSAMFLVYTASEKDKRIKENNKSLLFKVLNDINSSGRMPTKNYRDEKFIDLRVQPYVADYESLLGIADKKLIDVDGKKVEFMFEGAEPIIANLDKEEISKAYSHSPSLPIFMPESFDLKENKKITLGMHLPKYLPNKEKVKNGRIELYSPKGEKIVDSDFKIDKELKTGEVDLERVVRDNGFGVYNAAFFLDDKCWTVRQFEIF